MVAFPNAAQSQKALVLGPNINMKVISFLGLSQG
jgi:hypothetical protein